MVRDRPAIFQLPGSFPEKSPSFNHPVHFVDREASDTEQCHNDQFFLHTVCHCKSNTYATQ
jgi:hypothetical protein